MFLLCRDARGGGGIARPPRRVEQTLKKEEFGEEGGIEEGMFQDNRKYSWSILTMDNEHDPFTHRRRNTVRCDTKVRAHVQSIYSANIELRSFYSRD